MLLTVLKGLSLLEWECWKRAVIPISLKCLLLLKNIQINSALLVIILWFPFTLREASKIESLLGLISEDVNMPYIFSINNKWLPKGMQRSPSWWSPRDFLITLNSPPCHTVQSLVRLDLISWESSPKLERDQAWYSCHHQKAAFSFKWRRNRHYTYF